MEHRRWIGAVLGACWLLAACGTNGSAADVVDAAAIDASADVGIDADAVSGADAADAVVDAAPSVPPFDDSRVTYRYCSTDEAAIETLYEGMTLRQRLGQRLIFGADRMGDGPSALAGAFLEDFAGGNVFLGPPNGIALGDALTTARFVQEIKRLIVARTGAPPFVALDQEGGPNAVVNRVTGGTDTIGSMPIGATRDPDVAFAQFSVMGREVRALGFNMDFGPVVDTLRSTRNGNLNTRSFGPDPLLNAELGRAAVAGLQSELVIAMAKHFPGDGTYGGNTHYEEITVDHDRAWLDAHLLPPFRAVLAAGAGGDGVMTIPQRYAALDPERGAITSRAINTDLLRGELGFEGLIVTDALGMAGARIGLAADDHTGFEALRAGADLLLYVIPERETLDALYGLVEAALADGTLPEAEFAASTKRILRYKQRYCLFEGPLHPDPENPDAEDPDAIRQDISRPEDAALSLTHAERAVVLLHDDGALPLTGQRVLYAGPGTIYQDPGSGWPNIVDWTLGDALKARDATVSVVTYMLPLNAGHEYARIAAAAAAADVDVIVVGTLHSRFSLPQQQLVEWLIEDLGKPIVHVMLGVPFDYAQTRDRAVAAVAAMGNRSVMVEATAKLLYGEIEPRGTMLFDLDAVEGGPATGGGPDPVGDEVNRCEEQAVVCANGGFCVDTGAHFGCVCQPNWHPSDDGLDCVPNGQ